MNVGGGYVVALWMCKIIALITVLLRGGVSSKPMKFFVGVY